jgi:hypothetical protein
MRRLAAAAVVVLGAAFTSAAGAGGSSVHLAAYGGNVWVASESGVSEIAARTGRLCAL